MEVIETKYALDMHIDPGENQNWLYKMGKVFIKLNSVMTVTLSYKPYDNSNLYLRAMIVYTSPDDMHLQVGRCANHKASNKSSNENQGLLTFYFSLIVFIVNQNVSSKMYLLRTSLSATTLVQDM